MNDPSPPPGVPAWLAPTEKLWRGGAPNERLKVRPPVVPAEEETWRGEEGALRDEKLSALSGQWRKRSFNYNNLEEWIFFPLTVFEAEKNTVQVHQLMGHSLKTKDSHLENF